MIGFHLLENDMTFMTIEEKQQKIAALRRELFALQNEEQPGFLCPNCGDPLEDGIHDMVLCKAQAIDSYLTD